MAAHNELGKWGEEIAADFLQAKGYVILERDWHAGHCDIDIIAQDVATLVFVEVKTRRSSTFMAPELAVNYQKMKHLRYAMNRYIKFKQNYNKIRFDVITIVGSIGNAPAINHIEDVRIF